MSAKTEMTLTEGNIAKKMVLFALPLIVSGWLQLSFNLADYIVCGQFVSDKAVGAIGATGSLTSLLVDLFIGFAIGVNVVMGNAYGARNKEKGMRTIGSATLLALVSGIFLAIIGIVFARTFLTWMNTPESMIDMSVTYMSIIFAGLPFSLLYNFGASVMRGMGDSTKPFIFLTIGGVVNVGLNILFVVPIKMGVAGLALATIISEGLSAFLVYLSLFRNRFGFARFTFQNLHFYKDETKEILRIGVPAGIQGAMFDIANVLIQFNINSFGDEVISGDAAAGRISGYVYIAQNGFSQAAVAFISANVGAKNTKNIKKAFTWGVLFALIADVIFGSLEIILRHQLLGLIVSGDEALSTGELNILITITFHFTMCLVDVISSSERGLGYSTLPALVSFLGICCIRIIYIYTIFPLPQFHSMAYLYATYPISWTITAIGHLVCYAIISKKVCTRLEQETSLRTAIPASNSQLVPSKTDKA